MVKALSGGAIMKIKMNVSNHNANDVPSRVARNIREITRLLTNDSRNKDLCLQKVDICLSHISSVRGVLEDVKSIQLKLVFTLCEPKY